MNVYKSLPKNILWQLTAATDIDAVCIESTPVYIKKAQFSAEKYDRILTEASQYAIYSEETLELSQETKKYTCEPIEITADHIIVNDGRFAGVLLLCTDSEESYLHSCTPKDHMGIAFTDGSSVGITQDTQNRSPGVWHLTKRYFLKSKI